MLPPGRAADSTWVLRQSTFTTTSRDLHILQATCGAEFPMVMVRTEVREETMVSSTIHADLKVQFAG